MYKTTVITIRAWNRPWHLRQCLTALASHEYQQKRDIPVIVSVDGGLDPEAMEQTTRLLSEYGKHINQVFLLDRNKGCAYHTIELLEAMFENQGVQNIILMEDDHVVTPGCINFLLGCTDHMDLSKYFGACSYHRPHHQTWRNKQDDLCRVIAKKWFDGSSPCLFTKSMWEECKQSGGLFGICDITPRGRQADCHGEAWIKECTPGKLSWVWPIQKVFRKDRHVLYPKISRSYNIGDSGLHCDPDMHRKYFINDDTSLYYNAPNYCEYNFSDIQFFFEEFTEKHPPE